MAADALTPPLLEPVPRADWYWLTGDDHLRLTSMNSTASVVITVSGRVYTETGVIVPFQALHTPATDRTLARVVVTLPRGWLMSAIARVTTAAPAIGNTWVKLDLVRGLPTTSTPLMKLAADYVTVEQPVYWAGSRGQDVHSLEGRGVIRSIAGTDPAAGAEISETVPTNARWRLLLFTARFVSDSTAVNRNPSLTLDDGTTVLLSADPPEAQTATQNFRYYAGPGTQRLAFFYDNKSWNLPTDVILPSAYRIRTITGGLQAGDNYGAPQLEVEEWLEVG